MAHSSRRWQGGGGLQSQMLIYIAFIGTVFLTLAVEMARFLGGDRVRGAVLAAADACGCEPEQLAAVLTLISLKISLMIGILLLAVSLVMTLFIKRITIPLSRIIDGAARIGSGDLSLTMAADPHNELGRLAQSINDLSANYQELLLLVQDGVERGREQLAAATDADELRDCGLEETLDELEQVIGDFAHGFYGPAE